MTSIGVAQLLCGRMKVTENTELTTFLILLLNLHCLVVNALSLFLASRTYNNNNNNNNNNNDNNNNNNNDNNNNNNDIS